MGESGFNPARLLAARCKLWNFNQSDLENLAGKSCIGRLDLIQTPPAKLPPRVAENLEESVSRVTSRNTHSRTHTHTHEERDRFLASARAHRRHEDRRSYTCLIFWKELQLPRYYTGSLPTCSRSSTAVTSVMVDRWDCNGSKGGGRRPGGRVSTLVHVCR